MEIKSIWKADAAGFCFEKLTNDLQVDVAIIGGGITGVTAAHLLSQKGFKVAVLEAHTIAGGTTAFSTGNLYQVTDEQLQNIKKKHNASTMQRVCDARGEAIKHIEENVLKFGIDCEFKRVPFFLISERSDNSGIIEEEAKCSAECGLTASLLDKTPLPFHIHTAMKVENQAQLNPYKYTLMLAKETQSEQCHYYEQTKVTRIKEEGGLVKLSTSGGTVTSRFAIMATHTPKGVYVVHTLLGSYREYAVAMEVEQDIADGIYWITDGQARHSVRSYSLNGKKYLMVLGEKHKTGQKTNNEGCLKNLEIFARNRFKVKDVSFRWAAQHYRAADGIPFIGKSVGDDNIFIATGFSTDGLTYGTMAAQMICDQIEGKEKDWHKLFSPNRLTPLASAKAFIKENVNVAMQYIKDLPAKPESEHFKEIAKGEGKTIEINNEKYAAYRDEQDKLHVVSAVCPHLKCIVHFNSAEKSWDCPCHGSRFSCDGTVIEGPAISDLPKMNLESGL